MRRSKPPGPDISSGPLLVATHLSRVYPSGKGVFDIHLSLETGELVALVGPNGSGKSTLLKILATVERPSAGTVAWFGNPNSRDPAVRAQLGVVLDQPAHFEELSAYQNAWFFARQFGLSAETSKERLDELFHWAGLWEARNRLVKEYSLGMKRKLELIEAFAHRPRILFLDEPTLALDYAAELDLIQRLQLMSLTGTAVLLATNDVFLAERLCHRVILLQEGHVIREGRVASLLEEIAGTRGVELELHSPVPLEAFRAIPFVEAAAIQGDTIRVVLTRGANLAAVLAVLDGAADSLANVGVHRPNLGDLFLKLTGVSLPPVSR